MDKDKQLTPLVMGNKELPYTLMDSEDERQIVAEMNGEYIKEYVYSFVDKGGNKVVGLSKTGIDQACREAAKKGEIFRITDLKHEEDEKYYTVYATAAHFLVAIVDGKPVEQELGSRVGACRQPKNIYTREGTKPDVFYLQKAISKAQRNALKSLLPTPFIREMVEKYIEAGDYKRIEPDQFINASQIKRLHVIASKAGLDHKQMTEFLMNRYNINSASVIPVNIYNKICDDIEKSAQVDKFEVPQSIKDGFKSYGFADEKVKSIWRQYVENYGEEAEARCNNDLLKRKGGK